MKSIRIRNLRAFKDTGEIEIKPLTVAVGKNSCGKSTLLRIYPLLKQTLETKVSEPILWYGRYVDFGDYKQSINNGTTNEHIIFTYKFESNMQILENSNKEIILEISVSEKKIEKLSIEWGQDTINIEYGDNNNVKAILINGSNIETKTCKWEIKMNNLLPTIYCQETLNRFQGYPRYILFESNIIAKNDLVEYIDKILANIDINKDEQERLKEALGNLYMNRFPIKQNIAEMINKMLDSNSKRGNKRIFQEVRDTEEIKKYIITELENQYEVMRKKMIEENLNNIISACNEYIYKYFVNCNYIAPVRANAERYYRIQGLDIDEIDSQGKNIPMILKNMNQDERDKFNKWTKDIFGFAIETNPSEGHVSIYINKGDKAINIADTGFGYSQILPIIVLLWKNNVKINTRNSYKSVGWYHESLSVNKVIVIEQPELHLHPKMQAQLMDAIIEIIDKIEGVSFIIETHSQTIINHIGSRIEEKSNIKEKVNVLLVEQLNSYDSMIRSVKYSEEGYLEDWPLDFFSGEDWMC